MPFLIFLFFWFLFCLIVNNYFTSLLISFCFCFFLRLAALWWCGFVQWTCMLESFVLLNPRKKGNITDEVHMKLMILCCKIMPEFEQNCLWLWCSLPCHFMKNLEKLGISFTGTSNVTSYLTPTCRTLCLCKSSKCKGMFNSRLGQVTSSV